jgi:hypothetical protein
MNQQRNLSEGLRSGDLTNYVSEVFSVDRYSSKMGEDQDIVVLGFRVKEKAPAVDLMEFIEKGYPFILDADISTGEENDGQYQVFAEIQRTPEIKSQLRELLNGIGQLCNCYEWRFRYQKSSSSVEFTEENVMEHIPALESDNTLIFSKPYSGPIAAKLVSMGEYDAVEKLVPGRLSLDESSQSQCLFLTKYLGNYEINKIGNKFLIRNGDRGMIIEKDRW